jgi:hypothetical protein
MKRKIKWKNVIKLIIMLICLLIVIHDMYMVSISQFFTGELVGWTWYGFFSFIVAFFTFGNLYDNLFNK